MQCGPPTFSLGSLSPVILESLQFSLRSLSPIHLKFFCLFLWTLSAAGLVGNVQFLIGSFAYPQYEASVLDGTQSAHLEGSRQFPTLTLIDKFVTFTMIDRLFSWGTLL